jgi:biopolymer transport protein ExbD
MSGSIQGSGDKAEPNLVPVLDMVFQLITFFMLVINFKAAMVDRDLALPVLGSAMPVEEPSDNEVLVLNIRANGDLWVRGEHQKNPAGFIGVEAALIAATKSIPRGNKLPTRVVVRADKSIKVKQVLDLTDLCRKNGFERFDFLVVRSGK